MISGLLLAAVALLPQDHVQAEASVHPAAEGGPTAVEVVVDLTVAAGWHVYHPTQDKSLGIPVSLSLGGDFTARGETVSLTPAKPHIETIGGQIFAYQWLDGDAKLVIPATLAGAGAANSGTVTLNYQVCDDSVCLPPASLEMAITFDPANPGTAITLPAGSEEGSEATEASQEGEKADAGERVKTSGEQIELSLGFERASVPQGGTVKLQIETFVMPGYHIYDPRTAPDVPAVPFFAGVNTEGFRASGKLTPLQDAEEHPEQFGSDTYLYLWVLGGAEFELDVAVDAEPGDYMVEVPLKWQVCDESSCLDTVETTVQVPLTVTEGDPNAKGGAGSVTEGNATSDGGKGAIGGEASGPVESGESKINANPFDADGLWSLIWMAMLAGAATIFTPCVFPMIPITVSFFTKRAEQGKGSAMGNATAYTVGIILTFVGLGIGLAAVLGAGGANKVASNEWVNLFIGGMFVFLAFSLLGFFDLKPPKFLANFASKAQAEGQSKAGYFPVVLMAVAFSITAFTCTVAFVGGVLGMAATGEWWYATVAMFAYALVFALPFFFLALFPSMLQKMPQAGGWMNAVKVSFGYLELIAAWKFLSATDRQLGLELLTRPVVIILTVIPLLLMAGYLFGLYMTKGDYGQKPPRTLPRMAVGSLALAASIYLLAGYPKGPYEHLWMEAYLPPEYYGRELTPEEEVLVATLKEGVSLGPLSLAWHDGWESALEEGRERNAPVFLDFTGVTCVNCLKMEGNIFPKEGVADRIKQMVRAHLYVDKAPFGDSNTDFQEKHFKGANQPYYAVMDPFTEEPLATFNGYDSDHELFAEFLQNGIDEAVARGMEPLPVVTLTAGEEEAE